MDADRRDRLNERTLLLVLRVALLAFLCAALGATASLVWMMHVLDAGMEHSTAWSGVGAGALSIGLAAGLIAWWLARSAPGRSLMRRNAAQVDEQGRLAKAFKKVVARGRHQRSITQSQHLLDQLQATLDLAPVGIVFTRKHCFELVSEHFAQMLGRDAASLRGQHTRISYATPEDFDDLVERARAVFAAAEGSFDGHARMARQDGSVFWGRLRGRAVVPGQMEAGTLWIIEDVTQEREKQENLSWLAGHDPLTGLCNRTGFEAQLRRLHEQAARQPFSALCIDLDYFKRVNDTAGHAAGDKLLSELSLLLLSHVRQNDVVARMGGDEFAVLLPHCPPERALGIAEAIRREVEGYRLSWEGLSLGVGVSIGVIHHEGRFESPQAMLRAADEACYAAKSEGRNRVVPG